MTKIYTSGYHTQPIEVDKVIIDVPGRYGHAHTDEKCILCELVSSGQNIYWKLISTSKVNGKLCQSKHL